MLRSASDLNMPFLFLEGPSPVLERCRSFGISCTSRCQPASIERRAARSAVSGSPLEEIDTNAEVAAFQGLFNDKSSISSGLSTP